MKNFALICIFGFSLAACSSTKTASSPAPSTSASSSTPTPSTANLDRTTCTQNADVRTLEIKKTEAGGCDLLYTKFGTEKSVASSAGKKYCAEVREKISANLTRSGFKCE
jgi:hypothetical protein